MGVGRVTGLLGDRRSSDYLKVRPRWIKHLRSVFVLKILEHLDLFHVRVVRHTRIMQSHNRSTSLRGFSLQTEVRHQKPKS